MFDEAKIAALKSWTISGHLKVCLGVDIGGSGLRIRIANAIQPSEFVDLAHITAKSTADAHGILENLIAAINSDVSEWESAGAAFALAGPIKNGTCLLTNWAGDPEKRTMVADELPEKLCPRGKTVFLNDLEAGAYGVIAGGEQGLLEKVFEQMWPGRAPAGEIIADGRTAVLAMGSGLGAAMILKTPMLKRPLVIPTEWGHMQIPVVCKNDPQSQLEYDLIQHVSNHYHKGAQAPEFEDIASGRGLTLAYQFFKEREDGEKIACEELCAGEVARKAREGEKAARLALTWHYILFLRSAKNMATSLQCQSVLLALDNQVKNAWFVSEASDLLEKEFYNYIRPDWLTNIRVYTQTDVLNFNILGTTYMALQVANQ